MKILPKTRKFAKTVYIKVDDFREEKLEVFVANTFKHYDALENADDIRTKINYTIMDTMQALTTQYGSAAITPEIKEKINKVLLKIEKQANKRIVNQLEKTSKAYKKRHKGDCDEQNNSLQK